MTILSDQLSNMTYENRERETVSAATRARAVEIVKQRRIPLHEALHEVLREELDKAALKTQVGGSHYKDFKIQPVEYIHANKLTYLEGNVVKYVSRHRAKHGKEDLLKARHYIDLILELEYGHSE